MMSNMTEPRCLIEVDHIPELCQAAFVELGNDFTQGPRLFRIIAVGARALAPRCWTRWR
jgi:hypothetical protein